MIDPDNVREWSPAMDSKRDFNTAGPVHRDEHYCIPPLDRVNLPEVLALIRRKRFFVLHAPRQTGKTSALLALSDLLNSGTVGEYRCVYVNVEIAQTAREDVGRAMRAIISWTIHRAQMTLGDDAVPARLAAIDPAGNPDGALVQFLSRWAAADPRPLVLLLDEIDAIVGDSLVSVLRQLRAGYAHRPGSFPQSVVLCGVRDVRDYRIRTGSGRDVIAGGSAFNVRAESLRLGDFSPAEVATLLGQHTADTGQEFTPEAVAAVWEQTRGQPWLVNALAREMCFRHQMLRLRGRPLTVEDVLEARERLILRQDTHIDQLMDKLGEPRVRRVIEPLLGGDEATYSEADFEYVRDLGLVAPGPDLRIANPIYGEVLPRVLTSVLQHAMSEQRTASYIDAGGGLKMDHLLSSFQDFFRRNSEHWIERARYQEAGPQLVLQAFLHRVVNARGRIEREYALGSRRVDLLVIWPTAEEAEERFVVECKLVKGGRSHERAVEQGLRQTALYMDTSGAEAGHLVVFDMREGRSWSEKIFREERVWEGTTVTVWGA